MQEAQQGAESSGASMTELHAADGISIDGAYVALGNVPFVSQEPPSPSRTAMDAVTASTVNTLSFMVTTAMQPTFWLKMLTFKSPDDTAPAETPSPPRADKENFASALWSPTFGFHAAAPVTQRRSPDSVWSLVDNYEKQQPTQPPIQPTGNVVYRGGFASRWPQPAPESTPPRGYSAHDAHDGECVDAADFVIQSDQPTSSSSGGGPHHLLRRATPWRQSWL